MNGWVWVAAIVTILGVWALAIWLIVGGIRVATQPGHPRPERPGIGEDVSENDEGPPAS